MLLFKAHTLLFYLKDTVRLLGTLLLLDPIDFPKGEPCLIIGSVLSIWSTFRYKFVCINLHLLYKPGHPCPLFGSIYEASDDLCQLCHSKPFNNLVNEKMVEVMSTFRLLITMLNLKVNMVLR